MIYRVYPSIGIARLGNSGEFFIGTEVIGSRGRELDTGAEVMRFKDAQYRVRKQAARFHLFQQPDAGAPVTPAALPPGAVVEWTVSLANKKDAILRPGSPLGPLQPGHQLRPTLDPARSDRIIAAKASIRSDEGPAARKPMQGNHAGHPVSLGELRLDSQGRLLVLGGALVSASHPPTVLKGRFFNNPNWHDDVSDGPVAARVIFPDGRTETAEGAWALVAPPDFAPGAEPIVTLFDELLQVALDQGWASPWTPLSTTPSFTNDIYPLIRRGRSLAWVQVDAVELPTVTNHENWEKISQDFAQLSRNGPDTQPLRMETFRRLVRATSLLRSFLLPSWQTKYLNAWVNDQFSGDWNGVPPLIDQPTAQSLTRAALEGAVGQGFYPGIETGRITTDPSIYRPPFDFRIAAGALKPGDLTAFMAQPWQADFANCAGNWWPSHRPDLAPRPDGTFALWQRPVGPLDQASFLANVQRFGMITVKVDANGVQISAAEEGRDPTL